MIRASSRSLTRPSLFLLALTACSNGAAPSDDKPGGGDAGGGAGEGEYAPCAAGSMSGEFVLRIDDDAGFTGIDRGEVLDGKLAARAEREVKRLGSCRILQHPIAKTCTPACDAVQERCEESGCVARPSARDVGTVTMTGLKVPLTLMKIDNRYTNPPGVLPHPGFDEGANIGLRATGGDDGYGPFSLSAYGVASLRSSPGKLKVEDGKPVTLTWPESPRAGTTKIVITLGINWHGALDTWLECAVDDAGSYTIDASTVTELFTHGVSGYPRATISRRSAGAGKVRSGCVQLVVLSEITQEIEVPGLVSCNDDSECPSGQSCQDDLSCR